MTCGDVREAGRVGEAATTGPSTLVIRVVPQPENNKTTKNIRNTMANLRPLKDITRVVVLICLKRLLSLRNKVLINGIKLVLQWLRCQL